MSIELDNVSVEETHKEEWERSAGEAYATAKVDAEKAKTFDSKITTFLKIGLASFIAYLIIQWFNFMKFVVTDYVAHFHDNITELPSEVIIAVITLGTTITGLMTYILKGLFNPK